MKIVINHHNAIPNEEWMHYRKVRAIVENELGEIAITMEGNKCIFPGGKCEENESTLTAIKRELQEEMGIDFSDEEFQELLTIESIYEDYYDYRYQKIKPRYTLTTYYYVKTKEMINPYKMQLTSGEKEQNFRIGFVSEEELIKMLLEDHSKEINGKFFDEENKIIVDQILERKNEKTL